jgi:hypothetical protein
MTAGSIDQLPPTGRAGKEDHPFSIRRDVFEPAHHQGLTTAVILGYRNGRPQTLVQLTPELLHQSLVVGQNLWIALCDQDLAMPRLHAQKSHPGDYVKGTAGSRRGYVAVGRRSGAPWADPRRRKLSAQSQYVDRTWTRPNITQAIAHGLSRHPLGRPGRSQGVVAPGQAGGQDG